MAQQQSSRLNRLLTLLDTGSTLVTRRTAARQIGEIAKSRPEDLHALLKKVYPLLHNRNWDTRVAAATAVGAIAENVNHLSLKDVVACAQKHLSTLGCNIDLYEVLSANWINHCNSSRALSFGSFDIQKVMDYGAPLLSSGGQEYDIAADEKNSAERFARQKKSLSRRLGLDGCEQFIDVNEFVRDDDLMLRGSGSENGSGMHQSPGRSRQGVQQLVANMVPAGSIPRTLSARERNLLKRKAKGSLKETTKGWCEDDEIEEPSSKRVKNTKSLVVDQSQSGDKILMEAVVDEDIVGQTCDGHWPFCNFVEQLLHDIFDSVWEVRHGSMMALREILSIQAGAAAIDIVDFSAEIEGDLNIDSNNEDPLPTLQRKNDIDLNVGLVFDEHADFRRRQDELIIQAGKREESEDVQVMKLEQEHVDTLVSDFKDRVCYGSAKAELDLNEDIKPGQLIDNCRGFESSRTFFCKETEQQGSDSVILHTSDSSRTLKVYRAAEHAWGCNTEFLQDCAIRFLCVFSLDRFGDYVSDQVVAPVRETCAQVLGAVLKQMHPGLVHETLGILLQMQTRPEWEIRHGSLLGIKYLVAVRQEMLPELLPRVLPACIAGLEDRDDDVRAVAAEALTPAAAAILSSRDSTLNTILLMLWDILLDLDDLSPSTSSVMHLLAELYTHRELVSRACLGDGGQRPFFDLNEMVPSDEQEDNTKHMDDPCLLSMLAPRLWPFMRHNILSVRYAAISMLERILEAGMKSASGLSWVVPILGDALRMVYQNLLLEAEEKIVDCSKRVWKLLLQSPKGDLAGAADNYFASWLKLASTAAGSPLELSKMFSPISLPRKSHVRAAAKLRQAKGDGPSHQWNKDEARNADLPFTVGMSKIVVGSDTEKSVVQMRVSTSFALGIMAASLPPSSCKMVVDSLSVHLLSMSGVQRQVACMVLISWFGELRKDASHSEFAHALEISKVLRLQLLHLLACCDPAFPSPGSQLPYTELGRTYAKMRGEAVSFLKQAENAGMNCKDILAGIPPLDTIGAEVAVDIAMNVTADDTVPQSTEDSKSTGFDFVESLRQRLLATAGYLKLLQSNLHVSVLASVAGAVVRMGELPAKLNPIIQPLMAAIKREQEESLQQLAADALAETIAQCVGRKPSPNEKLTKNICSLTCCDPVETPQATEANANSINFDDLVTAKFSGPRQKSQVMSTAEERSRMEGAITRRGAEFVLRSLCDRFGVLLFEKLPKLWDCLTEALNFSAANGAEAMESLNGVIAVNQHAEPQSLINNLQVVCSLTAVLDKGLQPKVLMLLPAIFGCVRHVHAAVRLSAARCITAMTKAWREPMMAAFLENVTSMLNDASAVEARQGASLVLMLLVDRLGADLVPYSPLLIVPLLGCMSDMDSVVRHSATHSFAILVPLLPLAKGMGPPPGLNNSLLSRSAEDAKFLEQLLDNSRVDDYKLLVELKASLRRYQQEGINWLAFLKRFKLHGILCDDMGLGKTLQASAIVASDVAEHMEKHKSGSEPIILPSLIICPSTLVGHWVFEIEKFVKTPILSPLQYVGSPQDRLQLQLQLKHHNLIVTSYDVLRKDIEFLSKLVWNFCILDEGHIIRNSKSKVTLAVKQLKADHRLILSGTPIQNNVLELWSLFDFLMPGFLGSERQFQATFGKPILAARDAKCSAKEAEAGALAMEALHKQVMPFLLRRTKDEVLADLPPKIVQDRYCGLSPLQLKLYERFSNSQAKSEVSNLVQEYGVSGDSEGSGSRTSSHVFQALQYLRKLCSHPLLVLDEMQQDQVIQSESGSDGKVNLHDLHHSPKLLALKEILEECNIGTQSGGEDLSDGGQHRVLIFGQLKSFLDIIEKDLLQTHMKGVTYLRLDGSVEPDKRFEIVKAFNSDPTIDVLLLTTHVGGLGLNLTTADTVVFMEHDWNPMRDLQAMDRAHRLGQKRVVNVHRLIMRGTLEEKVMNLQRFKISVANTVVNAENASLDKMDKGQLLDLFTMSGTGKSLTQPMLPETGEDSSVAAAGVSGGKGLKAVLNGLEDLWDQSQYNEEYNLDQFVARLNG
ncbi:hypothetical protein GOP47_0020878 [Adiantum capillus-veneris]|uniref:TATA-binding protein-associated factor BTAF1 n=1 Tax=Adiantum capillus-veneris TaxID=13818 RepID=A0A9D4Z6I3_ADICA|nr:hypothetical protein GOP47_0020878 [Adiantum capillus-veneris]